MLLRTLLAASALIFASALAAGASSLRGTQSQTSPPDQRYAVTPNPAPANQAFTLTLAGDFQCGAAFTRQAVHVGTGRIDLSYVMEEKVGLPGPEYQSPDICPVYYDEARPDLGIRPYGPQFKMPALAAGRYEVWATRMHECLYQQPMCRIAVFPEYAGVLTVGAQGEITYQINPTETVGGASFKLELLSYQFNCATKFDNLAYAVGGNRIDLTFLDHPDPAALCAPVIRAYGPAYTLPALAPGTYYVYSNRLPDCLPCKRMPEIKLAGVLTVKPANPRKGWFLKEERVPPGKPFTMQLLNNEYGNCHTAFTHATATVVNRNIYATFTIEQHPEVTCIVDIRPWGPLFEMKALASGVYPVSAQVIPACVYERPACAIRLPAPQVVDTLVVSSVSGLSPMLMSSARAFQASVRGDRVQVTLPGASVGPWRAEVLDLSGKALASLRFAGRGGSPTEIKLGAVPRRGIYLVRLTGPDKAVHTLPVASH